MIESPTLFEAVRAFLQPLMAEGCCVIDEWPAEMPVKIEFGACSVTITLAEIKQLDRAFKRAHDAKIKRGEGRRKGAML